MDKKKGLYLVLGIVATVAFGVFSSHIYELMFYDNNYSNAMYNYGVYGIMAMITIAIAWVYYVVNSVKFDRWYHWLAVCAAVTVVTPVVCYLVNNSMLESQGLDLGTQAVDFEIANFIWAPVLFTVASFSMRWWSSNCRHTPFPQ
jgi:hypothetical protein